MQNKKQLFTLVNDIMLLNAKQWDNPKFSYDAPKGAALIIEEAFESLGVVEAKDAARAIVATASEHALPITEVDSFDALLDAMYIIVGELHKLGLTPHQVVDGLQVVHDCNKLKSGVKDSEGKVTKPTDFSGPEPKLQVILDERPR